MAEQDAAKAAEEKKSVLAKLTSWLSGGDAPPATPVVAAKAEPTESPEMVALAARLEKLEKDNESYRNELALTKSLTAARELCTAAHLAPKFEAPMAQYMAGLPEITLAEPERDKEGNVTKEYKLSRNDFFATVLVSKGTEKLDDPKKLADAPTKKAVTPFVATSNKFMPEDPAEQQVLRGKAEALARTEGKTIQEATNIVLAAWQKEQEA